MTVFSLAHQLVGLEKLLVDMMMQTEYVVPLFEACAEFQTRMGLKLIEKGVDAIWFGDDFGTQTSLIFPQDVFRRTTEAVLYANDRPVQARPTRTSFRSSTVTVPSRICSTTFVKSVLRSSIRCNRGSLDIFPGTMKEHFGDKFAFWGAIDQQDLLPNGTDEELEKDIIEKISILGNEGGYMIAPAHILQPDVSPDRVLKFIELCRKHGSYTDLGMHT